MPYNPFNPQQPARPNFFVGREPERKEFDNFLGQTINNSPMNMSLTGDRGMGKTSLLIKFEEVAEKENCLVIRISNYEGNINNIIEFSEFILSNIESELISKGLIKSNLKKITELLKSFKPTISWNDISLSVEKKQIIQGLLRERLVHIWEKIKNDYKSIIILIDEAESLEKIDALTFLREVFQRVDSKANYMIVLAGKLNFPERMSESFSPLNRFFPVHKLTKLDKNDVYDYIIKRLKEVNIKVETEALRILYQTSEGHPYVLVAMCYLVFDSLKEKENKITKILVLRSMDKIKRRLAQDFFSPMFHPLTPKAKKVICNIAKKIKNLKFNFKNAQKLTGLNGSYLSPYISELIRKGVINKPTRGNYQIFHSLFKEYIVSVFKKYS